MRRTIGSNLQLRAMKITMQHMFFWLSFCFATALRMQYVDINAKLKNVSVFYNVFNHDTELTLPIVREQLATVRSSPISANITKLYYVTIGKSFHFPTCPECHHLAHYDEGQENQTLQHLYDYCTANPSERVIYMHSKGSYHPSKANDKFRSFLMNVFSEQCLQMSTLSCNTCSVRFSPLPHHHSPGNMWMAECQYINMLATPSTFEAAMGRLLQQAAAAHIKPFPNDISWAVGSQRFSNEHWLHSHPSNSPCDLYENKYMWGYGMLPEHNNQWKPRLEHAPRFSLLEFDKKASYLKNNDSEVFQWRKFEWRYLYGHTMIPELWSIFYGAYT